MNPLQTAIVEHAQPELRRRIEVPEWSLDGGQTPLSVYYTMVTLDEQHQANELAKSGALNRIAPYIITMKATDEKGEKLFKMGDAQWLREHAAPDVLQRIVVSMLGRVSIEDARGN
jgi:hypothetical protein